MTYLKPFRAAMSAQTSGWNLTGLNDRFIDQYVRFNPSPSVQSTSLRDHDASSSTSGHDSWMPSAV